MLSAFLEAHSGLVNMDVCTIVREVKLSSEQQTEGQMDAMTRPAPLSSAEQRRSARAAQIPLRAYIFPDGDYGMSNDRT